VQGVPVWLAYSYLIFKDYNKKKIKKEIFVGPLSSSQSVSGISKYAYIMIHFTIIFHHA
jgi:hypothetical protein